MSSFTCCTNLLNLLFSLKVVYICIMQGAYEERTALIIKPVIKWKNSVAAVLNFMKNPKIIRNIIIVNDYGKEGGYPFGRRSFSSMTNCFAA